MAGIVRVLRIAASLSGRLLVRRPALVYMTLSQNTAGLARDMLYLSVCRLFGVKAVVHLHGSQLHDFLASRSRAVRRVLVSSIGGARRIVVCGEAIAANLRPLFGARVVAVPNATPPDAFPASRLPRTLTVAYMAHLSAAKGFYVLLSAAEAVLDAVPEARFRFAGERLDVERNVTGTGGTSNWSLFEDLSRRFPGRVEWVGVVTDDAKRDFLASSALFVLPSFAEAFPMSILEAMAAGLPVVATPVGAVPDVVVPEENGFLVASGDSTALTASLLRLLRDPDLRERLGSGAVRTARAFSPARQADALAAVFTSVIAE